MSEFNRLVLEENGLVVGNRQIDTSDGGVYFHGNGHFGSNLTVTGNTELANAVLMGSDLRVKGDITAFFTSDEKFKTNIKPVENATEKIHNIGTKTFEWNENYLRSRPYHKKEDFGVIAQDVQKVFPMAVETREDGTLSVDYIKLGILAFQAIKEIDERLKKLESN